MLRPSQQVPCCNHNLSQVTLVAAQHHPCCGRNIKRFQPSQHVPHCSCYDGALSDRRSITGSTMEHCRTVENITRVAMELCGASPILLRSIVDRRGITFASIEHHQSRRNIVVDAMKLRGALLVLLWSIAGCYDEHHRAVGTSSLLQWSFVEYRRCCYGALSGPREHGHCYNSITGLPEYRRVI